MKRMMFSMAVLAAAAGSGCAVCCTPWDEAYTGYGGRWQRTDRFNGRVGSVIYPAGTQAMPGGLVDGAIPPGAVVSETIVSGPTYGQPMGQPVYGQPMFGQPTPAAPTSGQPTPGQPMGSGVSPTPAPAPSGSPFQRDPSAGGNSGNVHRSAGQYESYYR